MPPSKGFTFGIRTRNTYPKNTTPSPMDYSTSSYNRFGKFTSPAFTIKSKGDSKENRTKAQTPSPLDYQATESFSKLRPSKSYSFGARHRSPFAVKSDTPPPNKYLVPTTIGNNVPDKKKIGREYTIQGRLRQSYDKSSTPGPGAYNPVNIHLYKKKEPAVKITAGQRKSPFFPADPSIPGPSQYDTLKCKIDMIKGTSAPKASFGIRHSPKKFTVFTNADISY